MASATRNSFFKQGVPGRDKAENTTSVARQIAESETAARIAKTERLRKLRIEKEAADEAAAAARGDDPKPTGQKERRRRGL